MTEKNSKDNIFEIEKLYSESGIYIIYNKNKKTAYIGQAKDMKERMRQHLDALYSNKIKRVFDNKNLLREFNSEDNYYLYRCIVKVDEAQLDIEESLYFQAALRYFGKESVHNKADLTEKYNPREDELNQAVEQIKRTIMEELKTPIIQINNETKRRINQDIIGKYEKDIILDACTKQVKKCEEQIEFQRISIKDLYEKGKLDHIIVGKMGDYIGEDNKAQSFTDIIVEKLACIADHKKCLWAANLPNIAKINNFIDKYGFGDEKRVYAIFALTSSKYKSKFKLKKYIHKDTGLFDTAPERKRAKALIIDKFMSVKEDFDFSKFVQNYYYHSKPREDWQSQRILMNEEIGSFTQLPAKIVSKKEAIINNADLQKELEINKFDVQEIDKFKKSIPDEKVVFSDAKGASYFIIAEVIKADWIYPIEE